MNWTSEQPTKPGLYLWRVGAYSPPKAVILGYARNETKLSVLYPYPQTTAPEYPYLMGGEWADPREESKKNELDL